MIERVVPVDLGNPEKGISGLLFESVDFDLIEMASCGPWSPILPTGETSVDWFSSPPGWPDPLLR